MLRDEHLCSTATILSKHLALTMVRNRIQGNMNIGSNPLWLSAALKWSLSRRQKCRKKERTATSSLTLDKTAGIVDFLSGSWCFSVKYCLLSLEEQFLSKKLYS